MLSNLKMPTITLYPEETTAQSLILNEDGYACLAKLSTLISDEIKKSNTLVDIGEEVKNIRMDLKVPEAHLKNILEYSKHHEKKEGKLLQKQCTETTTLEKNFEDKWDLEFLLKIDNHIAFYNSVEYLGLQGLKEKIGFYILMSEFKEMNLMTDIDKITEKIKKLTS